MTQIYLGLLRTVICADDFGIRSRGPPLTTVSSKRAGSAAGPARPGLGRRPAQPGVGRRLALPGDTAGYVDQTAQAAAWPAAPEGQDQWPCRVQDVTASAHLTEEGRGGEGCRGKGERGGEAGGGEGGKQSGQLEARAVVGLSLYVCATGRECRRALRAAAPARAQSHGRTRPEPRLHFKQFDAMHYILTSNCWFIAVFHIQ
jgi:hypothetical protein